MSPPAIYWFSGTGNSLALAKRLSAALDEASLVPIAEAAECPPPAADTVGVVFPVYWFGLPNLVDQFLKTVPLAPDPYVFTVATMAMMPGAAHWQAKQALAQRGVALAAGWSIRMPENYSPVPADKSKVNPEKLFEKADAAITAIASQVAARKRDGTEDSMVPAKLAGRLLHSIMAPRFAHADDTFAVEAHCTSCGTCVRVCPVNDIVLSEEGTPQWLGHCEQCFACMQWCPVNAIRTERFIANRRRYHHPDITVDDVAVQTRNHDAEETEASSQDEESGSD